MSFSENIKVELLNKINDNIDAKYLTAESFGECITKSQSKQSIEDSYKRYFNIEKLEEKEIKYILKGVFLSSGSLSDPNYDYHLELSFKSKVLREYIYNLLSLLEFTPKLLRRKNTNYYIIYLKESDQISTFLSLLEANNEVLKFEQIRVEKQVKNNINRTVNCEMANLSKTVNSSIKEINAIKYLKKSGKFEKLDDKLKYIALLREKYPDKSLSFIASKTKVEDKLTKSGIKHRLDKIAKLAQNNNSY